MSKHSLEAMPPERNGRPVKMAKVDDDAAYVQDKENVGNAGTPDMAGAFDVDSDAEDDVGLDDEHDAAFEAGQVMKVYVRDFMNHRAFEVNLGRKLNFITGANGAGKSAIVAALQLCLGVTARKTGRADSLASLIRHGSDGPAVLNVTLLNEGPDAFKPQEYGNRITVERTISRSGGGAYALKAANGKKVTGERRELEAMLRNFNIYCDNPCNVLTQEESKKFIQGKSEDKYSFFLKATGIDRTQQELTETKEKLAKAAKRMHTAEGKLGGKRANVATLVVELKELKKLDSYALKIKTCDAKALWVDVDAKAVEVDASNAALAKLQKQRKEAEARKLELDSDADKFVSVEVSDDMLNAAKRAAETATKEREKFVGDARNKKEIKDSVESDMRTIAADVKNKEKQQRNAAESLNEKRRKAEKSAQVDEMQYRDAIKQCDAELASLQEQKKGLNAQKDHLYDDKAKKIEAREAHKRRLQAEERNVKELEAQLRGLSADKDRLQLYDPKYAMLVSKLRQLKLKDEWVAPAGKYIQIKPEHSKQWKPIEAALGSAMKAIFVTTIEDQRAVGRVMKEVGIFVDLVRVPSGQRYKLEDISQHAQTVASCLTFSSDLAYNGMAEKANMGRVIILQKHDDFKKHLSPNGFFQQPIAHAFDDEGTKISHKNGNKLQVTSMGKRRVLQESQEAAKLDLETELAAAREALRELQRQGHGVEQNVNEFDHALRKLDQEIRNIDSACKMAKKSKEENKDKLEELNDDASLDTTDLEEELEALAKNIAEQQRLQEVSKVEMEAAKTAQAEAEAAAEAAKMRQSFARDEMDGLEASQRDFINQKAMFLKNQNVAKKAVEEFVGKLEAAEAGATKLVEKHASLKQRVEAATAELLGDSWDGRPLKVGTLSKEDLSKKKALLQNEFDAKKIIVGLENKSKEQTSGRLTAARADLHKVEQQHTELNTLIVQLSHDVTKRVAKLKTMREQNSKTVKRQFNNYLQNKRMKGKVAFDHDNQTLNMSVQADENDVNTLESDVRNMSGGERSYVTLCLLLSLGHIIECPFRLMDEYDVFMDQITRRTTLKQIQMYAVDPIQNGRQFIIITPQDLSDVQTSNDVRVHRVKPPVRGAAHGAQQHTVTEAFGGDD